MTDISAPKSSGFGKVTSWIAGITGILIVVPALINAGADVWASLANLPKSEAEKANVVLFKKHFGNDPLHRGEIPIKTALGTMKMELEVHSGGDIFVRYGQRSQWFQSPVIKVVSIPSFIGTAHAASEKVRPTLRFRQLDTFRNGAIHRERYYTDGSKRTYVIDPATGKWSKPKVGAYKQLPDTKRRVVPTFKYPTINLTN